MHKKNIHTIIKYVSKKILIQKQVLIQTLNHIKIFICIVQYIWKFPKETGDCVDYSRALGTILPGLLLVAAADAHGLAVRADRDDPGQARAKTWASSSILAAAQNLNLNTHKRRTAPPSQPSWSTAAAASRFCLCSGEQKARKILEKTSNRGRSQEQVVAFLWPDASEIKVRWIFFMKTLQFLRQNNKCVRLLLLTDLRNIWHGNGAIGSSK